MTLSRKWITSAAVVVTATLIMVFFRFLPRIPISQAAGPTGHSAAILAPQAERLPIKHGRQDRVEEGAQRIPGPSPRDSLEGALKIESFHHSGFGSPAVTVQTAIWAGAHGDYDALAACFEIESEGRNILAEYRKRLSDSSQDKFTSPEHLVALVYASELLNKVDVARIAPEQYSSPGRYCVNMSVGTHSSKGFRTSDTLFDLVNSNGNWRIVITIRDAKGMLLYLDDWGARALEAASKANKRE